ncbi:MAG: DNA repair protein RecO [Clostridiales bacterium]|nr:DNA repair protein RecO [Clostridiales bacterium]
MVQYKTEAVVLRLIKYRDSDALVTLLTRERGKISAVAKGVYKPASSLRGGVQPYSISEMMLDAGRSTLHTLIQSDCLEMLLPLRQRYEALALGAYWAELLDSFAQEELADEELFQLAKAGFLGLAVNASLLMGRVLEIRLIAQQGLRPDFGTCCRCGRPTGKDTSAWFSTGEGGFLCSLCANQARGVVRVSPAAPSLWQGLENLPLDKLGRATLTRSQLDELGDILRQWIVNHTGRPMKTWPLIKQMEG